MENLTSISTDKHSLVSENKVAIAATVAASSVIGYVLGFMFGKRRAKNEINEMLRKEKEAAAQAAANDFKTASNG